MDEKEEWMGGPPDSLRSWPGLDRSPPKAQAREVRRKRRQSKTKAASVALSATWIEDVTDKQSQTSITCSATGANGKRTARQAKGDQHTSTGMVTQALQL
eukprot:6490398-Amphidinium_carterae.2